MTRLVLAPISDAFRELVGSLLQSIATDESYIDRNTGEREERTEWHRVVTFQPGSAEMMEKHARTGRLVYVAGKLQTRKWRKDGEESDRFSTEMLTPKMSD